MRQPNLPDARLLFPLPLLVVASIVCQAQIHRTSDTKSHESRAGEPWVSQTLNRLTLEEKVGQILQIGVYGDYRTFTEPDYAFVRNEIQKYHIGSVALFARMFGPNLVKGTPAQVATILNQLQHDSKLPLLVGADVERGPASRLSDCPEFPFPMAFGAIGNPKLVEKFGAITAREARAVGIDWAYAPVAEVNSNPLNPIINDRSIGEAISSPALKSTYARKSRPPGSRQ